MKRRTFLVGGLSGASLLALTACTPPTPEPTKTTRPKPSPTGPPLPEPTAFERTAWSVDPFALGAGSYLALGATNSDRAALARPVDDKIFFAGEVTSTERPGTVDGAWESGIRVAGEVAAAAKPGDRIVIIGAGMAGATAATQLGAAGFEVIVVEGRNRIGGRIDTVTGDAWAFPVERGAGVVHDVAENPVVGALASQKVATKLLSGAGEVRTPDGTVAKEPDVGESAVKAAVQWAESAAGDASLADALQHAGGTSLSATAGENGLSQLDWLEHFLATDVEEQTGATPETLSARFGWSPPQGADRVVTGGYQKLVRSALVGVDVRLSAVVTRVTYGHDAIGIRFATGESLQADRLIVTVPLGVLKAGDVTFDPELPAAHRKAIKALGMGALEKVILRFDQPYWKTDAGRWSLIAPAGEDPPVIASWLNLEPATGEAVLVGLAAADRADKFAKLSDDEAKSTAMASLDPFLRG